MEEYFLRIESEIDRAYAVAVQARSEGLDPETVPEIPRAQDMAMRVEKLLAHLPIAGISEEIRSLGREMPREEVALAIARQIAQDPSRGSTLVQRLDAALRVGLAILTEGILVAPLEGLAEVFIRDSPGGTYLELHYAGPIRAAGGTAQALSVLLADVVRRDLGIGEFHPEPAEVERYKEEIPLYKHYQHLQYSPTSEEIETVVRHVPVCVSGEATEGDAEVTAFRDLRRVPTNGIRGGACLVIAEGLCQKASKVQKVVDKLGISGWEFLLSLGTHSDEEGDLHGPKYLNEAVGGRPVLAHPDRPGAFRLVYGRARTTGLAACAINPATMVVLHRFLAVGTQIKLEYPGKASAMALCDTIQGPIVELQDGSVTAVHDPSRAEELLPRIRRIVDLGEILVGFGEFLENNRALAPGAYSIDWHENELRSAGVPADQITRTPTYDEAVAVAQEFGIPLHPRYLLFWHDLSTERIRALASFVEEHGRWKEGRLVLPFDSVFREELTSLGFLGAPGGDMDLVGEVESSGALVGGLGLAVPEGKLVRRQALEPLDSDPLRYVSRLAGVEVRARAPSRIGARVGRPEKAHQRTMHPNVHALFPVGGAGGNQRSLSEAVRRTMKSGTVVQLGRRKCPACGRTTVWLRCSCGQHTLATGMVGDESLPIAPIWSEALHRLHLRRVPEVKGVKGLTSPGKVPEMIEKGILRAAHGISVYQDGTARFDLTDLPLTHFRPREIGTPIERLKELGYATDWAGAPLMEPDQLVEIFPQDVIVARSAGAYLRRLADFVDEELVHLYNQDPFYRAHHPEDLVGAILIALAPHTSGGVAGRLIGFTEAEACFAHPTFHAAKRRNCDGDEDSVTLLLDALLNFSRAYLPEGRGAMMDKPLVLTTRLNVTEIDKEAHNLDVQFSYPLTFYRAAAERRPALSVGPEVARLGDRVGTSHEFDCLGFTHDTTDIAGGPVRSAYREAGSMARIVEHALILSSQIRAVDVADAVTLVLNTHFLPDLMGNLKSYTTQKFRCKSCGAMHRRPPLSGRCTQRVRRGEACGGELLPTVFEASVRKYLVLSQHLSSVDGVTPYVRQRIQLIASSLATLFPGGPEQTTLDAFDSSTSDRNSLSPV